MRKAGLRPYAAECEPFRTQQPVVEAFAVFHYSFLFLVFLSEFLKFLFFFSSVLARATPNLSHSILVIGRKITRQPIH